MAQVARDPSPGHPFVTLRQPRPLTKRQQALGWLGEILITLGVLLLIFIGWQLWWTDLTANREADQINDGLRKQWSQSAGTMSDEIAKPPAGKPFAIMYIKRFGGDWSRPIVQGTGRTDLQKGVGHYVDSVMPGQVGNFAVAGHRTTYGRPFHNVESFRNGDPIVVETANGWYVYQVTSHRVVTPTTTDVLAPVPDKPGEKPTIASITLTTCHPAYSAEKRWIVHGKLVSKRPRAQGPPPEIAGSPELKGSAAANVVTTDLRAAGDRETAGV